MRKQVLEHITLYEAVKQAGLPWESLGYGENETILRVCEKIKEENLQAVLPGISKEALRCLFSDLDFWGYIARLLQEGIELRPILTMLTSSGDGPLSAYAYERVKNALQKEGLEDASRFFYLKYYDRYLLCREQIETLTAGLAFLRDYTDISLEALKEPERKLLWEPVFADDRLKEVVTTQENLRELLNPGVLPLLEDLGNCCGFHYGPIQWEQLLKDPVSIRADYQAVTKQMVEEDVPDFFLLWMENEALSFDLKKLKTRLPQMSMEARHQMTQSKAGYSNALYGGMIKGISLGDLSEEKEKLLIYAITQRKKHFLSLVEERFEDFKALPRRSLLLDPDVYRKYLNINEVNEKELEKCFLLQRMDTEKKERLTAPSYLF